MAPCLPCIYRQLALAPRMNIRLIVMKSSKKRKTKLLFGKVVNVIWTFVYKYLVRIRIF